jgi:hypothetical protein
LVSCEATDLLLISNHHRERGVEVNSWEGNWSVILVERALFGGRSREFPQLLAVCFTESTLSAVEEQALELFIAGFGKYSRTTVLLEGRTQ